MRQTGSINANYDFGGETFGIHGLHRLGLLDLMRLFRVSGMRGLRFGFLFYFLPIFALFSPQTSPLSASYDLPVSRFR